MAVFKFDCMECGAHGKINFKETNEFRLDGIVCCPFCGSDVSDDTIDSDYEGE
jgi:uncharacterized Zn finger protein (UPF0148 family)